MDQQKLRELEQRCMQECAPYCAAACPVHVDVRAITAKIMEGNFDKALFILKRAVPFPGVLSRICDQPCRSACRRKERGGALLIAALERACVDFGACAESKTGLVPSRGKQVAIAGAGLAGLSAALDLRKKGYDVVLFEATKEAGGSLRSFPPDILPREIIEHELAIAARAGIDIRYNTNIGRNISLQEIMKTFPAILIAAGKAATVLPFSPSSVDPETFATCFKGVFAAGGILREATPYSAVLSISEGRRAAASIDRYLQAASLTAGRTQEGSYVSCLHTSLDGVGPVLQPEAPDRSTGFSKDQAREEASRCIQCQCLECVKVCVYLEKFRGYPKKYVREIYNNLSIVMGMRKANTLINSCSLCGLCAEACPNDLDMADVCRTARQTMVEQKRMPPSAHEFALQDMIFSNSPACSLVGHKPGESASQYLFFPGCQLCASHPVSVEKTYDLLLRNTGFPIGIMLGCCGAPADWAGQEKLFNDTVSCLLAQHSSMGSPILIVACPSCTRVFRSKLPPDRIISLWEFIDREEIIGKSTRQHCPVAVHDPCSARYDIKVQDSVRQLLKLRGIDVNELSLSRGKTQCCSFGGLVWFANSKLSHEIVQRRAAQSDLAYVTYCAMCRDALSSQGKNAVHLLDLILDDAALEEPCRPMPGYSRRRENRILLREKLLETCYEEPAKTNGIPREPGLFMSDEVRKKIDARFILDDDIRQVIVFAEKTGKCLKNRETGDMLSYLRIGSVTFWVEYSRRDDVAYIVHNAYSHRMQILGAGGQ